MNHEEKIIGMLEQMNQRQDKTDKLLEQIVTKVDGLEHKVDGLEKEVRIVRTTQENTVIPQIKLLAEGHAMLSEKIDRLSVIDAMQMDIDTLKAAVSYLTNELAEIKKAM